MHDKKNTGCKEKTIATTINKIHMTAVHLTQLTLSYNQD